MVNGPSNIFFERHGKVQKSDLTFVNEEQLLSIAKRIASRVGRRVDELSPTVDARLEDGSRVNIVIPPIALDGTSISIRKFREQKLRLRPGRVWLYVTRYGESLNDRSSLSNERSDFRWYGFR